MLAHQAFRQLVMNILLWLFNNLPFPFQCLLISNQKRNCIKKVEHTVIWLKCHDWFVNYSRTWEYFTWKPDVLVTMRKGMHAVQGTDGEKVTGCFLLGYLHLSEWWKHGSAFRDCEGLLNCLFWLSLHYRRHYHVKITFTIFRREKIRDSRQPISSQSKYIYYGL